MRQNLGSSFEPKEVAKQQNHSLCEIERNFRLCEIERRIQMDLVAKSEREKEENIYISAYKHICNQETLHQIVISLFQHKFHLSAKKETVQNDHSTKSFFRRRNDLTQPRHKSLR